MIDCPLCRRLSDNKLGTTNSTNTGYEFFWTGQRQFQVRKAAQARFGYGKSDSQYSVCFP